MPFIVNPTRLALVSSGDNTDMLLHTPRARIHGDSIQQKKLYF